MPEIRDDVSYVRGKHVFNFGTDIKPIRVKSANQSDVNFVGIGLGGLSNQPRRFHSSLRDISTDPSAQAEWDRAFPLILGRYAQTSLLCRL